MVGAFSKPAEHVAVTVLPSSCCPVLTDCAQPAILNLSIAEESGIVATISHSGYSVASQGRPELGSPQAAKLAMQSVATASDD